MLRFHFLSFGLFFWSILYTILEALAALRSLCLSFGAPLGGFWAVLGLSRSRGFSQVSGNCETPKTLLETHALHRFGMGGQISPFAPIGRCLGYLFVKHLSIRNSENPGGNLAGGTGCDDSGATLGPGLFFSFFRNSVGTIIGKNIQRMNVFDVESCVCDRCRGWQSWELW